MEKDVKKLDKLVKDSQKILVIASQPIDQDCISSGLVIKKYLEHLGKSTTMLFPRELTEEEIEFNSYLPYFNEFTARDTRPELEKGDFDTLILLDGTNWMQFYDYKNEELPIPPLDKSKSIIQIDHHLGNPEELATCQIKDSTASSTIEVILSSLVPIDFLNSELALVAYSGLVGDTGNFRWNFSSKTLKLAGSLMERGAKPPLILDKMFFSKSKIYLEALSYAINNTEYDDELHAQFLTISAKKREIDDLSEGQIDFIKKAYQTEVARSVIGYPIGFFIVENIDPRKIHISARGNNSLNKLNLPDLLKRMGGNGGGHFNAASMDCEGEIEQVLNTLKNILKSAHD